MGFLVRDLMEEDIVDIPGSETMREAAKELLRGGSGSIAVDSEDEVLGVSSPIRTC